MPKLSLRKAGPSDKELLFRWANDALCRQKAFRQQPIPWPEHEAWFEKKLRSSNTWMYLLLADASPAGQIRLDLEGSTGFLDYSMAEGYRGKGFGRILLLLLETEIIRHIRPCALVQAKVKKSNIASQRCFLSLSYREEAWQGDFLYTKTREQCQKDVEARGFPAAVETGSADPAERKTPTHIPPPPGV